MPLNYDSLPKEVKALADKAAGKKPRPKRLPRGPSVSCDVQRDVPGVQASISKLERQSCHIHKHVWYAKEEVACWECLFEKEEAAPLM